MKETDLSQPISDWLRQIEVETQQEVGKIDMVGMTATGELVAVEMKLKLNLEVICQATDRQRIADIVYIAVPYDEKVFKKKRFKETLLVLKRLGIGLLTVKFHHQPVSVEEILPPTSFDILKSRRSAQKQYAKVIKEFNARKTNLNLGGSTGQKLMTAYRERAIQIAFYLDKHGHQSAKAISQFMPEDCKVYPILYHNHYGWFYPVSRGVYGLSEAGKLALVENKSVLKLLIQDEAFNE